MILFAFSNQFHVVAQSEKKRHPGEYTTSQTENGFTETGQEYSFMGAFSKKAGRRFLPEERTSVSARLTGTSLFPSSAFSDVTFFGPYNCAGRTRAILPDRADSNLIFAGTNTGGLWKSTNGGFGWAPVNDHTQGMNITCIDQNPFNPDVIYYGTGEHKVRKIIDRGNGIYKSSDHGLTFSVLQASANDSFLLVNSLKHSLVDSSTFYVATSLSGIFRSTDGGISFHAIFNNGKRITDIECFPDGKVMFTAAFDGIYYSATGDSGTFIKSTSGLPYFGFSRIEVAYCDSFPFKVYAVFGDSIQDATTDLEGVYKSNDGGLSWFAITNPDNIANFVYSDYMLSIAVKPDNPGKVFIGGERGSYSNDGGQTFYYLPFPRFDQHAYVFNKFNNDYFYAGQDQGIYRFDLSQFPLPKVDLIHGYNTVQIWGGGYFPSGNNFFFGSQDNVFQVNSNGDSMFVRINGYGSDGKNTHVNQQNPAIGYACGDFAEVFRIDNMSDSLPVFTTILNEMDTNSDGVHDDDVWHENMLEMNYLDGDQLYLPTRDYLWRSTNGGNNWTRITNSFAGGSTAPHPFAVGLSNVVYPKAYVAGTGGLFFRIDDAFNAVQGQEVDLSASMPPELIAQGKITCLTVHPLNDGIVYTTVLDPDSVSRIWKIVDANTANPQWIDISGNFSNTINTWWIEPDPNHPDSVLFVGTDYGLWSTTDGGTTWFRETDVPMITIFQMRLRKSDRKLFVYTFGRGIWICELPSNNTGLAAATLDKNISVYPNPSSGIYNLNVLNNQLKISEIIIEDKQGRTVHTTLYHQQILPRAGVIDLSGVASGIYFATICTNLGDFRKKMVKL